VKTTTQTDNLSDFGIWLEVVMTFEFPSDTLIMAMKKPRPPTKRERFGK
jgi:hypothetical protein